MPCFVFPYEKYLRFLKNKTILDSISTVKVADLIFDTEKYNNEKDFNKEMGDSSVKTWTCGSTESIIAYVRNALCHGQITLNNVDETITLENYTKKDVCNWKVEISFKKFQKMIGEASEVAKSNLTQLKDTEYLCEFITKVFLKSWKIQHHKSGIFCAEH